MSRHLHASTTTRVVFVGDLDADAARAAGDRIAGRTEPNTVASDRRCVTPHDATAAADWAAAATPGAGRGYGPTGGTPGPCDANRS